MTGAPWEDFGKADGPWNDFTPPATPAPAKPTSSIGSLARNAGAGFEEGLIGMQGMAYDMFNPIAPLAQIANRAGEDFGSGSIVPKYLEHSQSTIEHGLGAVHPSLDPANTQANTWDERLAHNLGTGASAALMPGGEGSMVTNLARNTLLGLASGTGKDVAEEAAPKPYKPIAGLAGSLIGGGIGAVASHTPSAMRSIATMARDYVAPFTKAGQARTAGEVLASRATDPAALRDNLDASAPPPANSASTAPPLNPNEMVPGSKPTTFQQTGDMGLGSLEREVASRSPKLFVGRRAEQNAARIGALGTLQSDADPNAVADFFRSHLDTIDRTTSAHIDDALAHAQAQVDAIGGRDSPEAYGDTVRTILQDTEKSARAHERSLWNAVDPNRDIIVGVTPTKAAADEIVGAMSGSAKPLEGEEAAIFNLARGYKPQMPLADLGDLRSRVSAAMAAELRSAGATPSYARLTRLRGAIQNNLDAAARGQVEQDASAVAAGTKPPEDTIASRLQGWVDEYRQRQSTAIRTGSDAGATAIPEARAVTDVGADEAGLQSAQGLGSSGSTARLPENADDVEFNPGLNRANFGNTHLYYAVPAKGGPVEIDLIKTLDGARSQGSARAAMNEFLEAADRKGLPVALTPEPVGPGSSVARLTKFYKSLGFKPNGGRTRDFSTRATMIREPKPVTALPISPTVADGATGIPEAGRLFDEDAAKRLADATAATRDRARTFGRGPNGSVLAKAGAQDLYRLPEARVPEKYFHPGPSGYTDVGALRTAIGDEKALPVLQDYAAMSLRRAAERADGTLDPTKVATWQARHSDAMRAFPALRDKFSTAAKASQAIADATALKADAMKEAQTGAVGRLIGAKNANDVTRNVAAIFGNRNATAVMADLAKRAKGSADAIAGLRQAVVDHITQSFVSNTEAGTSGLNSIKSDQFQTFLKKNQGALSQVFNPEEMKNLQAIADDLRRANRSVASVRLPGQSNTAQDLYGLAAKRSKTSILARIVLEDLAGAAGYAVHGLPGGVVGWLGVKAANAFRAAGLEKVNDLLAQAMLHPEVARELLKAAPARPAAGPSGLLAALRRSGQIAVPLAAIGHQKP